MTTPLYIDAGYNKLLQPPVYVGFVYRDEATVIEIHKSFWDEEDFPTSSTEAEYYSLIYALIWLRTKSVNNVIIYSDSQVLVRQVLGYYGCHVPRLERLLEVVDFLSIDLQNKGFNISIEHIPREDNIADGYIRKVRKSK